MDCRNDAMWLFDHHRKISVTAANGCPVVRRLSSVELAAVNGDCVRYMGWLKANVHDVPVVYGVLMAAELSEKL